MSITPDEIKKVAHLGRLAIQETDIPIYTQHLNNLLQLIERMNKVDTTGIEPMSHPLEGQHQRLRMDSISEINQREIFQKTAPEVVEGLYLVPIVVE